jgi:hypothetical protein
LTTTCVPLPRCPYNTDMFLLPVLLAAGKVAGKVGGKLKAEPPPEGIWKYIDAANELVQHPNFEAAIRNPWFWGGSIAFMAVALLRGWKGLLIVYVLGIVMWGIIHHVVLKDTGHDAGSSSTVVFAGLTVGVAGIAIYFLLIRD